SGFSLEASVGYLRLTEDIMRTKMISGIHPEIVTFRIHDEVMVSGPFLSIGVGYRKALSRVVDLSAHAHIAALFAIAQAPIDASASVPGTRANASVLGSDLSTNDLALLAMPSIDVTFTLGQLGTEPFTAYWFTTVGFLTGFQLLRGPRNRNHG